jgi:probable selenium-dependent hydroxylase accessory protein YqeC
MRGGPRQSGNGLTMLVQALNLADNRMICVCGAGGKTSLILALAGEFAAAGERVLITTTTKLARDEGRGRYRVAKANSVDEILALAPAVTAGGGVVIAHSGLDETGEKLIGFSPDVLDAVFQAGVFDRILVEADGSRRKPLKAPDSYEPVFCDTCDGVVIVAGMTGVGRDLSDETLFRADIWARLTGLKSGDSISPESVATVIAHSNGSARGCSDDVPIAVFLNQADTARTLGYARDILRILSYRTDGRRFHAVAGWLQPAPGLAAGCHEPGQSGP